MPNILCGCNCGVRVVLVLVLVIVAGVGDGVLVCWTGCVVCGTDGICPFQGPFDPVWNMLLHFPPYKFGKYEMGSYEQAWYCVYKNRHLNNSIIVSQGFICEMTNKRANTHRPAHMRLWDLGGDWGVHWCTCKEGQLRTQRTQPKRR